MAVPLIVGGALRLSPADLAYLISAGCLTATVLNLLFNHLPARAPSAPEADGPTGGGEEGVAAQCSP